MELRSNRVFMLGALLAVMITTAATRPSVVGPNASPPSRSWTASGPSELVYVNVQDPYYPDNRIAIVSGTLDEFHGSIKPPTSYSDPWPLPMAVDAELNVYVSVPDEFGVSGKPMILVYKRGVDHPFRTITGLSGNAAALAVGPDGAVYQAKAGSPYTTGVIDEIRPGASSPAFTLSDATMHNPVDLTVSPSRQLFVAWQGANYGHVKRYPLGSSKGKALPLQVRRIGGIAIDESGNVVIMDFGSPAQVEVYGQNSARIKRAFGAGYNLAGSIAFDATRTSLFATFMGYSQGGIERFDYASGAYVNSTDQFASYLCHLAVSPPPR